MFWRELQGRSVCACQSLHFCFGSTDLAHPSPRGLCNMVCSQGLDCAKHAVCAAVVQAHALLAQQGQPLRAVRGLGN